MNDGFLPHLSVDEVAGAALAADLTPADAQQLQSRLAPFARLVTDGCCRVCLWGSRLRQHGNAPKSIAVSSDGHYVYSADYGESRSVSVVDTHDWTARIFKIPAMDRGSGVAVGPDGKHALVTGW